jgi:predicted amidohydrolase YtcJ
MAKGEIVTGGRLLALGAIAAATVAGFGCAVGPAAAPQVAADAVYTHGKVVTVDDRSSVVQAFAVKDGRYLAVGSDAQMRAHVGPGTTVIDLHGRTVVPGIADGHFHAAGGGPGIDLSGTRSIGELLAQVSQAAAKAAPGAVLVSNSDWHEAQLREQRTPTAAELESAALGKPVVVVRGGHSVFLNTTALAKWNITTATAVPDGGAIPRDAQGRLTGELVDNAKRLIDLPAPAAATLDQLEAEQRKLNSYGLTSVRLAAGSVDQWRQLQQLRDAGRATVRYSVLFREPLQRLQAANLKQGEGDDWVRATGVKMIVDGGFEGGHMSTPYAEPMGQGGRYKGIVVVPQAAFNDAAIAYNRAGWRVAVHAVGDAGVDEVLEGFEKANADKDIRQAGWTIEHAFVTRPDQYPRIKNLGVRMSVQDHLYLAAPVLRRYWGAERASQVTPAKTYLDQGFLVAAGTDAPVIPVNPFWSMYHFLTRETINAGPYGPNEAVRSRDMILRLFTINNARLTDEAAVKGSIEPRKLADFVVLSQDILTIPPAQVQDLKAVATFVNGRKVYQDPRVPL